MNRRKVGVRFLLLEYKIETFYGQKTNLLHHVRWKYHHLLSFYALKKKTDFTTHAHSIKLIWYLSLKGIKSKQLPSPRNPDLLYTDKKGTYD